MTLQWTPCHVYNDKKIEIPDPYGIFITFKNMKWKVGNDKIMKKESRWNDKKEDGWKSYKAMYTGNGKLSKFAQMEAIFMEAIDWDMNKIKWTAFGN